MALVKLLKFLVPKCPLLYMEIIITIKWDNYANWRENKCEAPGVSLMIVSLHAKMRISNLNRIFVYCHCFKSIEVVFWTNPAK